MDRLAAAPVLKQPPDADASPRDFRSTHSQVLVVYQFEFQCPCEERSDEAISSLGAQFTRLLRFARKDTFKVIHSPVLDYSSVRDMFLNVLLRPEDTSDPRPRT